MRYRSLTGRKLTIVDWAPAVVGIVAAVFNHGQLVGRIKNQEITIKDHDDRLDEHDHSINSLGNRMTATEAWKEGYNAGRTR